MLLFPATVNDPEEATKDADETKPFRADGFSAKPAFEAVYGPIAVCLLWSGLTNKAVIRLTTYLQSIAPT